MSKRNITDTQRLDWLADPANENCGVYLPREYVMGNLQSLRDAIDAAMHGMEENTNPT